MFWSGNFMVVRELNFLLKEENVTLASVLEADDILQECKADNKALIQFLTRPDILAELITLITEEPPKNVELSQQYRQASIACEVLTSHLSTLSDRLTLDTVQMNRLCDFINKEPPLNPLLASYFSKTVEMLLERSPKQDWYLYHIVCLRVLDFFKSRRDFLPNLLRHISTSAIADTFKYLIRLDDLFNKPIMEWLEEHQFLDSLIQIICGTYVPEHFPAADEPEKGQREPSEKEHADGNDTGDDAARSPAPGGAETAGAGAGASAASAELSAEERRVRSERAAAVAAANAAALLCDLVTTGCAGEGCSTRSRTAWQLAGALGTGACVRSVLCHVFTCPPRRRARALHHAARLLHALLHHHTSESEEERQSAERAVAPHLPLLHQALLIEPRRYDQEEEEGGGSAPAPPVTGDKRVGAARIATAALIAQLALSEVEEVATTLLTLGTPGVLVELVFEFPQNNFLHAQVLALVRNALSNRLYRTQYATHLFMECDMLTRLMDAFEENEDKLSAAPRAGYMGHVIQLLGCVSAPLEELAEQVRAPPRWPAFRDQRLAPLLLLHDTPLGGTYPSDNIYETGEELDNISDTLAANFDFSDMAATANMDDLGDDLASDHEMRSADERADAAEFIAQGLGLDDHDDKRVKAQSSFLELASQRFDDDMWDDGPEAEGPAPAADAPDVWTVPAWESGGGGGASAGGEGWARFDAFAPSASFAPPASFASPDSFAPPAAFAAADEPAIAPYWPDPAQPQERSEVGPGSDSLSARLRGLALQEASLAGHLLTAMSALSADAIANLVNANLQPPPPPQVNLPPEATVEVTTPNPVTPPAEFSNPPSQPSFPSEPSPDPSPEDAAGPAELNDTDSSQPQNKPSDKSSDKPSDKVELNCVTHSELSPESESSTPNESSTDDKVNDLTPDKVTEIAKTAIESHAIEVSEGPLPVTDASER